MILYPFEQKQNVIKKNILFSVFNFSFNFRSTLKQVNCKLTRNFFGEKQNQIENIQSARQCVITQNLDVVTWNLVVL
jgi:hypothetical protein